ncbi:hypothetical protein NM688_g6047 [Phlebia brevispora]|uniref:Uncharacterized protein n=1 Tax=Phlebia brevispora TaxID=194682 RepID=A0ACC1SKG7_9APHY|nr:hypothetical protein NM688_g6047 [Phlebia brevispora]
MAPPRQSQSHSARRSAQRRAESPVPNNIQRQPLSTQELQDLTAAMQREYGWDSEPRPFQIAGVKAQLEGNDLIIQAATGAGKTAVVAGPHLSPRAKGKISIMVVPLLALQSEMVQTFETEFKLKAVAINSTHGIFTPGLVQSREFVKRVLRKRRFSHNVLSMVIDEAHCVSHWGANFRKKYNSLGAVRAFLPPRTPVVAVTATLTARVRRDLCSKLHFPRTLGQDSFYNCGNDRKNVSIVVRAIEHAQNTYTDLDFLIPRALTSAAKIPKSYVYVDDIKTGGEIIDYLTNLIRKHSPAVADEIPVRPYNAMLSDEYREAAMREFKEGKIRILVCTDAAGMGCNVPDIDIVVQWRLPKSLSQFVQRAGRAARRRGHKGLAVLLVERSAYSIDLEKLAQEATVRTSKGSEKTKRKPGARTRATRNTAGVKAPKGYAEAHGLKRGGTALLDTLPDTVPHTPLDVEAEDEGLLAFVQTMQCRRNVWNSVFESRAQDDRPVACCDVCSPTLFDRTRAGPKARTSQQGRPRKLARGIPDAAAEERLNEWREEVFERDHPLAQFDAEALLPDELVETIVSLPPDVIASPAICNLLRADWLFWDEYGDDLVHFIRGLNIKYIPISKPVNTPAAGTMQPGESPAETVSLDRKRTADSSVREESSKRSRVSMSANQLVNPPPQIAAPPYYPLPQHPTNLSPSYPGSPGT